MYTRQSRKPNTRSRFNAKAPAPKKADTTAKETVQIPRRVPTFEDLKQQLTSWATNEKIPGKIQAWFTKEILPENCDWKFVTKKAANSDTLILEPPAKDMAAPEVVTRIEEQLKKEHLRVLRKAIRQVWFRATGDGRFALLVQTDCYGKKSVHEFKTFAEFLQRNCPEIISCHQVQCQPDKLFDPAYRQTVRTDLKCHFGNDFIPLAETGFRMHILDWAPRMKDAWLSLPARIKDALHPSAEDKFFEFYSGCSFVSASLAGLFSQTEALDCRESAMLSTRQNTRNLAGGSLKFHREQLEANFFLKFFSKAANDGRWTFYFNLPSGEGFPSGAEQAIAAARPERILLQAPDLETAAKEIKHFRREGYILRKSVPLYLEPGTGKFDLLVLFVPDRAGLLGQNPALRRAKGSVMKPKERISREKNANIPHFVQSRPTFKQRKD